MNDIKQKLQRYGDTVLITGATSGIGRAFAQFAADAGMNLILVARNADNLNRLKDELESRAGIGVLPIAQDLSEPNAATLIARRVAETGWHVDVLINNAGAGQYGWFDQQRNEQVSQTIMLNSYAPTLLVRHFLPAMRERKRGAIIFVSGILADFSAPFFSVYSATKAYVQSFAQALYGELSGSGVDILALSPGYTETNFMRANAIEAHLPFPKASPDRVVRTACRALGKQPVVVDGVLNRVMVFLLRFMPRSLVSAVNRLILLPESARG